MYKSIDPKGYGIAKWKANSLKADYESFFAPLVGQSICLLELGVYVGASIRFWRDYFENATIVGLDCNPPIEIDDPNGKIHIYQGYQQDTQLLDRIANDQAPDGFDVIIDDCSHIGRFARISFWHLFQNHLKPGGLYAIEDWGTGYVRSWPDGRHYKPKSRLKYTNYDRILDRLSRSLPYFPRLSVAPSRFLTRSILPSHRYGMVGFAKELLDACQLGYRAIPRSGSGRYFDYGISAIHVNSPRIIVLKSKERDVFKIDMVLTKDSRYTPSAQGQMAGENDST